MATRRLHPAGIAVYALAVLRENILPLVVVLALSVLGGGELDSAAALRGAMFALLAATVSCLVGLMRWAVTRYGVSESGVHFERGWLSVKEVDVPVARIQALDTSQGPIQRLFGVVALHVQTGGGGAGGEIVLDAVNPQQVEEIRALLAAHRPAVIAEAEEPRVQRRLERRMLLVAALTSGQLGVIVPALAGLASVLQSVVNDEESGREAFRLLPDTGAEWALAVAALLAAAWALSVLGAIVAFSGFTVVRHEDRLRIRRGLLQRREVTLPVGRVRAIRVVEGLLRQPLGLATVRVEVIGHAQEPPAAQTLFPLLRMGEVSAFLAAVLPELADDLGPLERPPARARRRYLLGPGIGAMALGALACLVPGAAPWPLLVVVPAAAAGWLAWRAAGWRLEAGRLVVRFRRLARTTVLGPAANRESHAVAQTLLQRRAALADVGVAFGKATNARVRHLDAAVAWRIWRELR
jgi:putative membrane protein